MGYFLRVFGSNKWYVDGKPAYSNMLMWTLSRSCWIKDSVEQLGHDPAKCVVYRLLPRMSLGDELRGQSGVVNERSVC